MNKLWNEKLRQLRKEKGVSQEVAAKELQLSRTCYAGYEQGIREPSLDTLKRICDYFDISADYLIGRTDTY